MELQLKAEEGRSPRVAFLRRLAGPCWAGMLAGGQERPGDASTTSKDSRLLQAEETTDTSPGLNRPSQVSSCGAATAAAEALSPDTSAAHAATAAAAAGAAAAAARGGLDQVAEKSLERVAALQDENRQLKVEIAQLRAQVPSQQQAVPPPPPPRKEVTSEGNLSRIRADVNATSAQLREAIASVEAMCTEARRELAAMELRERRAAYEALERALSSGEEGALQRAIDVARAAGVDAEELTSAEGKLEALRSMTEDERRQRDLKQIEATRRREAFLLVRRNDAEALEKLLDGLDPALRWKEWRDHNSRTMWRCALDQKHTLVQAVLAPRLGLTSNPGACKASKDAPPPTASWATSPAGAAPVALASPRASSSGGPSPKATPGTSLEPSPAGSPRESPRLSRPEGDLDIITRLHRPRVPAPSRAGGAASLTLVGLDSPKGVGSQTSSPLSTRTSNKTPSGRELSAEDKLKARALRAVVQDDGATLSEVLEQVDVETMKSWHNRAGTDLITLCEERGRGHAYSILARKLGLLVEQKREAFQERDTVWVFLKGDVQAKQATVLEDTPEEADQVLLQLWDGEAEQEYVDRSQVRRCNM